jgi:hypothetical protein
MHTWRRRTAINVGGGVAFNIAQRMLRVNYW